MAVTDLPDSISFSPTEGHTSTRGRLVPAGAVPVGFGILTLLVLVLSAALVARPEAQASAAGPDLEDAVPPDPEPAAATPSTPPADETPAPPVASFPAEPTPIPVDLLTRLEGASDSPLETELGFLLDAIQHGFGRNSARLEPTLRSYVYRMTSRFAWNPDSFRVAVTAPNPELAAARGELLKRLFEDAIATGRLEIGTGTGAHALMVIPE